MATKTVTLKPAERGTTTESVALGRVWWVGLGAVAAAVLVNALVRLAALAVITVDPAFMPLQATAVLPATVVGAGAAVIVYALLARFTARPLSTFRTVAAIALPLSYLPDLALLAFMPGATLAAVLVLMLMHTLTAVIVVGLLTRFTRAR